VIVTHSDKRQLTLWPGSMDWAAWHMNKSKTSDCRVYAWDFKDMELRLIHCELYNNIVTPVGYYRDGLFPVTGAN